MLLNTKTAIVTGGAARIGLGITKRLVDHGASVVIADIDQERGEAVSQQIRRTGGQVWFVHADISEIESIDNMINTAIKVMGRIDILVNNAGVTRRIGPLDISPDDWDWIQKINTRGMFFCLQRTARHMKEIGGGRIINISSVGGKGLKSTSNASYAASKSAAIVVARVAANELGKYKTNVNSICPGPTRTDLWDRLVAQNPEATAKVIASASLGRVSEPEDIANAVVFLASDMASNITGQSLNVCGGTIWDYFNCHASSRND